MYFSCLMLGSLSFITAVPKHFGTRDCFHGIQFFHRPEPGDDLGMIRAHYIYCALCMRAKSLQSCPTLCNPVDCSLPGSSLLGILQARILECVAMPSSRDLPDPGSEPVSLRSPALAGGFFTTRAMWEAQTHTHTHTHTHTQYRILLRHKKEQNWVIRRDVDGPTDCHTE